ncbi:MAG: Nif3-like dinuclear metal center hexameric protein [Firmicutes bacterium]|nr:Nif3-like dinuclear metal center hexameric protein [Bacillota bacterium]
MLKIADICRALDDLAPQSLAAPWDNPGLLLGDAGAECGAVMVALDLTDSVFRQAEQAGCGLVITHHPFIFAAQKQVLAGRYEGDMILALAQKKIAAVACHTNWDNAPGGINYALAEALGLQNITPICTPQEDEILLLSGEFPSALSAADLAKTVCAALGLPLLRAAGLDEGKTYCKLAVCGGAGMDFWAKAAAAGCDALLSADPKHHEGFQAAHTGFALLDGTHFATEVIGIRRLGRLLQQKLPDLAVHFADEQDAWAFRDQTGRRY